MAGSNLKREIGVWGLSSNLINTMIGAGIFVLPAMVASGLGTASILAYLFCGILISLVMLCFAEVGSIITSDGGVYAYIDKALGDYFGFNAAFLFLVAAISADAAVAHAVIDIADSILPFSFTLPMRILGIFLIFGGLAYLNVTGVRKGLVLVKAITIAKLAPLVLFVLFVSKDIQIQNLAWSDTPSLREMGQISLLLFFAFQGGESGLSVSGEVRNPQKTIPRSIFISIGVVLLLYLLVQTISQGVLGPSLALFQENTLGEVASKAIGPLGLTLMTIGAGVSMFGNLSSEMLSIPRILYGASKDRVIPIMALSRIHPKYATPSVAIVVYAIVAFIFTLFGGFRQLAILSSATVLLVYFAMAMAVIRLRLKNKDGTPPHFRIPGGFLVPVITALVILWFLSSLTGKEIWGISLFIGILSVAYMVIKKYRPGEPRL